MRADVIVVGLGTMGSATVEALTRRGVSVIGVDRWLPPHGRGAHAGGTRIIRLAYAEGSAYVPLLRSAYSLWPELEQRSGRTLLTRTGALTIGRPEWSLLAGVVASAQAYGLDCQTLSADEVARRFEGFRPAGEEIGVLDEAGGVLTPEAAIGACLDLAGTAGARLLTGVTVDGWHATSTGVTVRTGAGDITGDRLVLCAGAGAPELLADLAIPWHVERRIQHFWRPAGDPGPFAPERFPAWMWQYEADRIAYGLPWQEYLDPAGAFDDQARPFQGGGVKAAFHHGEGAASRVTADERLADASEAEVASMRQWLRARLPALAAGDWVGGLSCRYTLTPDEHFVLGPHPIHDNVAVAAGFSGHGFKFLPVVGEVLADLALTGGTTHPIALFAPDRFAGGGHAAS